ncbi:MAG: ribonuclease HII [Flavobacterium sp. BFFFF2]|nr:MAG: ribonuclease HII [Flavobacterium sp. BFFFF2]
MLLSQWSEFQLEAGADEAGRGCLAGPVTAAAVLFPDGFKESRLNDSKKLSKKDRDYLRPLIEDRALSFHVVHVDTNEIDKINILNASIKGMSICLENLNPRPEFAIVDGNRFHRLAQIPHQCIIKGDSKYLSIAAASILAKTYRDELMFVLDQEFPEYGWKKNKGYPTKAHFTSIMRHGASEYHRKTFRLFPNDQFSLDV